MKEYIKFRLKEKQLNTSESKQKETQIYLYFRNNSFIFKANGKKKYLEFKLFTGEKVKPAFWDYKNQRVRQIGKVDYVRVNNILNQLYNITHGIHTKNLNSTPQQLKALIKKELDYSKGYIKDGLLGYINKYYEKCKSGEKTKENGTRYSESSIGKISQLAELLKKFQGKTNICYLFKDIDRNFYEQFLNFTLKSGYHPNTFGKHIRQLKKIMQEAEIENLHQNISYKEFKDINIKLDHIYLTETEIDKIYNLNLDELPRLKETRDVFIIGCDTALRFSNIKGLKRINLRSDKKVEVYQSKVDEKLIIPLTTRSYNILKKYNCSFRVSNPEVNRKIKVISKLAGITEMIEMKDWDTEVFKFVPQKYYKYEKVHMHSSRRSACSNLYKRGMPAIQIMSLSGHKKEDSFFRYINIGKEENAELLAKHPFFNDK